MNLPIWLQSVHHDGSEKYVSHLYPRLGEQVRLRLRVDSKVAVQQVHVRIFPDGEQSFIPMTAVSQQPPVQWWEADLPIQEPTVHYRFVLTADDGVWWYSAAGPTHYDPLDNTDFRILADYQPVEWLKTAVFYQIFPDRFANGDPTNDPQPHEYDYRGHRPQTYPWEAPPADDAFFPIVFYGGDLQGIAQKLDYLQSLGVNAIYLNPVFTAHSNHKYDVSDYDHVDPHLGGDEALTALRQALTARGMRYILDIVPNHCGYWHPWFQTARTDAQSPEASFFTFTNHPEEYATWLGVWSLPKLNYNNSELRQRIYAGQQAVFRRWLQPPFSADGWRVDVANMLGRQGETQIGHEIAQGIRQAVKETSPQSYLMGENFFDASAQLQGDEWDGVMNYMGLTMPLWHWLNDYTLWAHGMDGPIRSPIPWPTTALEATWRTRRAAIPWAVALQQYNLVGSHDVPRILSMVQENEILARLAAIVQFTFPGVPGIYYGDEIGMSDVLSLGSRGCMVWDEKRWNHGLLAFYRSLIQLRKESAVLQDGGFQMLLIEPDTFVYQREGKNGRILVTAHRNPKPRPAGLLPVAHGGIPDGTRFIEHFSRQEMVVANGALPLPEHGQGARLWIEKPL